MSKKETAGRDFDASRCSSLRDKETCKKKRSFFTQKEANVIGRRNNQRSYECPVCHCWHLTTRDFYRRK